MKPVLHHPLRSFAGSFLCVVLLAQVLLPAGLAPPRPILTDADGTLLATPFYALSHGADDAEQSDRPDRHHHHCMLCRLPGLSGLGAGIVHPPMLPVRMSWERNPPVVPAADQASPRFVRAFPARGPPPSGKA